MQIGVIGLPNVGKSTLFTALTKKAVGVSNYPFTTIDPNVGVVAVPDDRLGKLAHASHSEKIVPASVEFIDIAGLVRGANKGEGLGNQFLAHIREVDAIVEVVRAFDDPGIVHVEGVPDPMRDHRIVETELMFKDLETVQKRMDHMEKELKTQDKEALQTAQVLEVFKKALMEGTPIRTALESDGAQHSLRIAKELSLLTAKPLLALVNANDENAGKVQVEAFAQERIRALAFNIKEELSTLMLTPKERQELELAMPAVDVLISEAYALLGFISFLTTGPKESRAWTVVSGTKAPQAAGVIHSDFEKKFIRAETIHWKKLIEAGGWAEARAKGWVRSEGKEYIVQDGDVLDIKHG